MFGATPPRRTTRSSTRNDSETRSNWSGSSESVNRPGKCMRWSVAMDPATMIGTQAGYRPTGRPPTTAGAGGRLSVSGPSVERVAAGAGVLRIRVVDREALLLDGVHEVDGRAVQIWLGHPVH